MKLASFLSSFLIPTRAVRLVIKNVALRPSEIGGIAIITCYLWNSLKTRKITIPKTETVLFILFITSSAVSSMLSSDPKTSLLRCGISLYIFALSISAYSITKNRDNAHIFIIYGFLWGALITSTVGIFQTLFNVFNMSSYTLSFNFLKSPIMRATGFFKDPNYASLYISTGIIATVHLKDKGKVKGWTASITIALLSTGLFFTFSRSGAVFLITAASVHWFIKREKKIIFLYTLPLLISLAIFTTRMAFKPVEKAPAQAKINQISTGRLAIWKTSLEVFAQKPVFGVGPFLSQREILKQIVKKSEDVKSIPPTLLKAGHVFTHNNYLNLLVERGVIGFSLFAVFMLFILLKAIRNLEAVKDEPFSAVVVVGFLTAGLFLDTMYELTFWIALGMLIAVKEKRSTI